ncbi:MULTISPECIES: MerR family transcriptional regulator [Clostridium]|uniref:Transcriptional regulator, MerR family n=1 Tax=Clostridium saccharoperbutylacetonicum N1-4(HMT) TaxID=931276 RepID=M1MLH3_9CLOT|nr:MULTISPECIES: MerR family transcriptional regulator [Clostridium]AGF58744.1 transcriptional regulator, MerR family [Clostridium saccharoperbutylacetonicum N1-4(HMT)]AQR97437.1 HTH-type transcriptional regulator AdhR [Clostridium saccharoperbutylacetonicum]NRT60477.1 DNA-binding transcriptional MerR regulator [Clostridium saccharoperbutylacetonicum]NSB23790.1 DNA-binding transcriptional MerR regulator [Clostridium saccharoperbutylacetonicum]NSB33321.1 DNA-binding transcriptional MerR regulat
MYTINEVANICNISPYTIRFYDKEGLLPFVSRNSTGNRQFSDSDLNVVKLICCLKNTGMQVKEIRRYIDLVMQGVETNGQRKQIMIDHRKEVIKQIDDLKKNLNIIDLKIALYDSDDKSSLSHIFSEQ